MYFQQASFIKTGLPWVRDYQEQNPAPLFRRPFRLPPFRQATLAVCGLGIGYYWLNGQPVSDELLTAPVSNYNKTLWFNVYDVTRLLVPGDNIAAVICGNGWYNESFRTPWRHNEADWRDNPKFILELTVDGEVMLVSDATWRCSDHSPILFNQLRSGETYDARLDDPAWNQLDFDDAAWPAAIVDPRPPRGALREYRCQPVRACAEYPTREILPAADGRFIFDLGQNIAGFIRLKIRQNAGDLITIRYAEQINPDRTLQLNNMEKLYPESPFQTDRVICSGQDLVWSPRFAYHGFRYVELSGVQAAEPSMVTGIFVHLDVRATAGFACSDTLLNRLYRLGQMATLSNLQHVPTDCPTREKLGWANDAQASAEQMLINFDTARFFRKWLVDIRDSIRADGAIPGIIPTPAWGYEWGTGPVSSGVLFEVPDQIYRQTGDDRALIEYLPDFHQHLAYMLSRADESGLIGYGLCDWAGPFATLESAPTPVRFTDTIMIIKCLKIALLATERARLAAAATTGGGVLPAAPDPDSAADRNPRPTVDLAGELARLTRRFKAEFINPDGTCTVNEQTAIAMLIVHDVHDGLEPLAAQLRQAVEAHGFHHHCGMVGLRHLYEALNQIGAPDYAYRVITAQGYPSYADWVAGDATTLWETWQPGNSKNHHMYSHFMAWLMKTLVGINPDPAMPGYARVILTPAFLPGLAWCRGWQDTAHGRIAVDWQREESAAAGGRIILRISLPAGVEGVFGDRLLPAGEHDLIV